MAGDVVPSTQSQNPVMDICETMRAHQSAFVALNPQYTLIMYPIGISTWSFFDSISPAVEGALMRYRLYTPMQYSLIEYKEEDTNIRLTDRSFVDVTEFLDSVSIHYETLPSRSNSEEQINNTIVFLNYPMTNNEELIEKKLIGQCLALKGARVIFSGQEQAWIAFVRNPEGGVVLVSCFSSCISPVVGFPPLSCCANYSSSNSNKYELFTHQIIVEARVDNLLRPAMLT